MAFTAPRFQEVGETEFIENLLALFHRDMKLALDYFDRQAHANIVVDNLPDFAVMTDGDVSEFQYPVLVLGVEEMDSEETDDGWYLNQDLKIGAGLVVQDTNLKLARIKVRKYIRAFKAVIRSASAADLLPPTAQILNHEIRIQHRYLKHATKDAMVQQPIEVEITIKFGEK
jgi:hypothetical protein